MTPDRDEPRVLLSLSPQDLEDFCQALLTEFGTGFAERPDLGGVFVLTTQGQGNLTFSRTATVRAVWYAARTAADQVNISEK